MLGDSASAVKGAAFLVNQNLFAQLKEEFVPEMLEQIYRDGNISFHFYTALRMLQDGRQMPLVIYSIARDLNRVYKGQKAHELGFMVDSESRFYDEEYNELLRMMYRWRLSEIADLAVSFCNYYEGQMKGYEGFEEEMAQAKRNKAEQQ